MLLFDHILHGRSMDDTIRLSNRSRTPINSTMAMETPNGVEQRRETTTSAAAAAEEEQEQEEEEESQEEAQHTGNRRLESGR